MARFFKLVREIKSKQEELHFRRWKLFTLFNLNFYIHKIYLPDRDEHLHNHPWDYFSLVLKGDFIEQNEHGLKTMNIGKFVFRNGRKYHKIFATGGVVTTLFITTKRKYNWGYLVDGKFIGNKKYRELKNKGEL